jgi:hypothetical protein
VAVAAGCNVSLTLLFDQSLTLVMKADPGPNRVRTILHGEGAETDPDPRGAKISDFLEMQGGLS